MKFVHYLKSFIKVKSSYQSLNRITIKKDNLIHNFQIFQKHKPDYTIIPVLKSNAYGHGLRQISQIVNLIGDCKLVAVDSYPEYQVVYQYSNKYILIMGETSTENYKLFDFHRTHVAVWNQDTIHALGSLRENIAIHIFINTGMNREGVNISQLLGLIQIIKEYVNLKVVGVMSHLACADEPNHPLNKIQADNFYEAVQIIKSYGYNPEYIHLEGTGGMIHGIDTHNICTAARLGIGLYGMDPCYDMKVFSSIGKELKPILDIYSTITAIQDIKAQETVGYGASRYPTEPTKVGIFPFGYMEGIDREISGKNYSVKIGDNYCPLAGRVSMNYSAVVLSNINLRIGTCVHIISSDIQDKNNIYSFYEAIERIPYEIVKVDTKIKRLII